MGGSTMLWVGFNLIVAIMLVLDLGVFQRTARAISLKEATIWSLVWIGLAMTFNAAIWMAWGKVPALEFLTGYLIEKSLSVDNIFVFVLIFSYFQVPAVYQRRVLFWGVLGALAMRGALIMMGAALLARFHWVIYLFGGFLVITGVRIAFERDESEDLSKSKFVLLVRRLLPFTEQYDGQKFFTKKSGALLATPLFLVLLLVEVSDLVFALDSIPAIFAVTKDAFLVYTSNVFAILGLRSLYFLLAGVVGLFRFLKLGLSVVLAFVGVKMLLSELYPIPIGLSLAIIIGVLGLSVLLSVLIPKGPQAHHENL